MRRYGLSLVSEPLEPTGVGIYATELVRAAASLLAPDEQLAVIRHVSFPRIADDGRIVDIPLRFPARTSALRRAAEQALLPWVARREGISLLHAMNHVAPLGWRGPLVVTLHDTRLFVARRRAGPVRWLFRTIAYPATARRAGRLITGSAWAAARLAEAYRIEPSRIAVVPHGVDHAAIARLTAEDRARVVARLGLEGPAIVFTGAFEPNKNVLRLLEAFARMITAPAGHAATLVLAGGGGAEAALVRRRLAALGLEGRVRLAGYLPRTDLLALVSAARALVLPSLDEGFGLPVLEAFACGTPVLAGQRGALPELAGDAALLVDPEDIGAIVDALLRLLTDEHLAASLAARGRARAATYTWEAAAAATLATYRACARRS